MRLPCVVVRPRTLTREPHRHVVCPAFRSSQDDATPRSRHPATSRSGSIWVGQIDGSLQLWHWRRPLPHLHGSARLAEAAAAAAAPHAHEPADARASEAVDVHEMPGAYVAPTRRESRDAGAPKPKVEEMEREEAAAAPDTAEVAITSTISWLQTAANDAAYTARQWQASQGW